MSSPTSSAPRRLSSGAPLELASRIVGRSGVRRRGGLGGQRAQPRASVRLRAPSSTTASGVRASCLSHAQESSSRARWHSGRASASASGTTGLSPRTACDLATRRRSRGYTARPTVPRNGGLAYLRPAARRGLPTALGGGGGGGWGGGVGSSHVDGHLASSRALTAPAIAHRPAPGVSTRPPEPSPRSAHA